MTSLRSWRLIAPLLTVAAALTGHLVAYQVRYGARAAYEESTGVHAYLPALVGTVGALLGGLVLASFLMLAAARLLVGRRDRHIRPGKGIFELLPLLFTAQLALFLVQEHVEALAAGTAVDPIPTLLLWGTLSQLPVALVAALTLAWLSTHVDAALQRLSAAGASFQPRFRTAVHTLTPAARTHADLDALLAAHGTRAPPPRSRHPTG